MSEETKTTDPKTTSNGKPACFWGFMKLEHGKIDRPDPMCFECQPTLEGTKYHPEFKVRIAEPRIHIAFENILLVQEALLPGFRKNRKTTLFSEWMNADAYGVDVGALQGAAELLIQIEQGDYTDVEKKRANDACDIVGHAAGVLNQLNTTLRYPQASCNPEVGLAYPKEEKDTTPEQDAELSKLVADETGTE